MQPTINAEVHIQPSDGQGGSVHATTGARGHLAGGSHVGSGNETDMQVVMAVAARLEPSCLRQGVLGDQQGPVADDAVASAPGSFLAAVAVLKQALQLAAAGLWSDPPVLSRPDGAAPAGEGAESRWELVEARAWSGPVEWRKQLKRRAVQMPMELFRAGMLSAMSQVRLGYSGAGEAREPILR
jgi:hypothetical protein